MFPITYIDKRIRALRRLIEVTGISEELRGYNWENPPIEPINDVRLSISDLNGFCPTKRDIFLKYVLKEKIQPNKYMLKGLAYHKVIKETITSLKKAIYSGYDSGEKLIEKYFTNIEIPEKICKRIGVDSSECVKLYRYLVLQISARVDEVLAKYPEADADDIVGLTLPFVERRVDGSLVGLSSRLSLDIFTPYSVIMDFKSGYERDEHPISLAGYALALEADEDTEVNIGFLIYLKVGRCVQFKLKGFAISDELRREFLEIRDEMAEIVDSGVDPGRPRECPRFCPYYGVCNEGCG